jgi:tetratricopeptide (TPR) repeat protein
MLADLLRKQRNFQLSEMIYRQTGIDFPHDAVCRTGLAEVLKQQNKWEEAEAVYRQAGIDFPHDAVCRNGLAEVLKQQNKWEEAEAVYRQAGIDFKNDVFCRTGLAGVLLRLKKYEDAVALLEETKKQFPHNQYAKEFLEKIKRREDPKDLSTMGPVDVDDSPGHLPKTNADPAKDFSTADRVDKVDSRERSSVKADGVKESTEPETDVLESELGMINLYRLASYRAEGEEKEAYRRNGLNRLDEMLGTGSPNLPVLQEKGWWLVEQRAEGAEDFFRVQTDRHPNMVGLQLAALRFDYITNGKTDAGKWKELAARFPIRSTLVKLEHAMQELPENGPMESLETLRKQLTHHVDRLPASLRRCETWAVDTVKQRLFQGVDVETPLETEDIPRISANFTEYEYLLKGVVEQSLNTI